MNKNTKTLDLTPLAFIDVETTGLSPERDRIIELGIIRVENGVVVDTLDTLVNPHMNVSPNIQMITGIRPEDVYEADSFESIYPRVLALLKDAYFVAHSARFDYGFIRNELKCVDVSYKSKLLCTARLSRALYKQHRRHNLSSIIKRHNIKCKNRHRAYDDANAMWQFYKIARKETSDKDWERVIAKQLKNPSLPKDLDKNIVDLLPDKPGIYKFYDKDGALLYIGKSTNIRSRVQSHLTNDRLSAKQMAMCQQIANIDYTETAGELGALLLESYLIKKNKPLYNRQLRERKDMVILKKTTTKQGYDTVEIQQGNTVDVESIEDIIGVFRSKKSLKDFLSLLSEKYTLCERLLELHKTSSECFSHSLGKCKGACVGKELPEVYNRRFLLAFAENKLKPWYFDKPITLVEYDAGRDIRDEYVIDKWCLLHHKGADDYTIEISQDYMFDIDTYKILVRYIQKIRAKKQLNGVLVQTR